MNKENQIKLIEARLAILNSRTNDNGNIIRKLQRKIRKLNAAIKV